MNERATELNALAVAMAKLLFDSLDDVEIKLLLQFLQVLQSAIRSYRI